MFAGKRIAVGITGGIAAYKTADLVSRLKKLHADVTVVMTKNAQQFITMQTMETLSGGPVVTDLFARPERWEVEHIALAKWADLFAVVPASANVIAKLALGLADDFLSTSILATKAPLLIAPAMNTGMWEHPATQQNIATLTARGATIVGPGDGFLAEGMYGKGRLIELETILDAMRTILLPRKDWLGKKVLVTAGPTREPIDPVRYLSNRSSGRMGINIADAAHARGADVTLLLGPTNLAAPSGITVEYFTTTLDLYELATRFSPACDVIIQAAAPGDFRAETVADNKIKKSGDTGLTLRLVQNPDIAAVLGERKRERQMLIGFAAETDNLLVNARDKLRRKNVDMIVANDITKSGAGFDVTTNIAMLITETGAEELPLMDKRKLADVILDRIIEMWNLNWND